MDFLKPMKQSKRLVKKEWVKSRRLNLRNTKVLKLLAYKVQEYQRDFVHICVINSSKGFRIRFWAYRHKACLSLGNTFLKLMKMD
ncbi:hypothetical protein [Enterococcus sp. DIV1420a]|uniref:hypothetical protein n=1 Tax=Enterococcus sp. DIV1420a TaxID=2774672 RepID=UPI0036D4E1CD